MAQYLYLYYSQKKPAPDVDIEWELLPNKLFVVDNIETYLAEKSRIPVLNFQYVKNALEVEINVDLSQTYSQPLTDKAIQYVSIQNEGEQVHYYFVKKATWRSKSCVRLELVMDVLNTFQENRDYYFKANTKINREHKERYVIKDKKRYLHITFDDYNFVTEDHPQIGVESSILDWDGDTLFTGILYSYEGSEESPTGFTLEIPDSDTRTNEEILALFEDKPEDYSYALIDEDMFKMEFYFDGIPFADGHTPTITYNGFIYRNIDSVPENILPLLQCDNTSAEKISATKSDLEGDWYLLYRNVNDPDPDTLTNPVECYLIPSKNIKVAYGIISAGRLIPSWLEEGKYYYFKLQSGQTFTTSDGHSFSYAGGYKRYAVIYKSSQRVNVVFLQDLLGDLSMQGAYDDLTYIQISPVPAYYTIQPVSAGITASILDAFDYDQEFNNSGTENLTDTINEVDRTDAKNIKLIKLPYCPYDFTVTSHTIQVNTDWDFVSLMQSNSTPLNCFKLLNLKTKLISTIEHTDERYNPYRTLYMGSLSGFASKMDLRQGISIESKLFNSEFYQPTFYYDSFAFKIELEKLKLSSYMPGYGKNTIKFLMTSTINSKFMFIFDNYITDKGNQNYSKYLPITRNNEEVLYNVAYLNYVRSGFNYDMKSKSIQSTSNALGISLSALSVGASLLLPSAPLKAAGVIASLVSIAQSVKNAVVTEQQAENSIRQKLEQAQNQTTNVAGSDDVDLMSEYAENRLKYVIYKPRDTSRYLIYDLFFYAGYRSDRMGVPNHNTRINFDYLECDASIEKITTIPNDCLDELINCFKNGVTYIHYVSDVYLRPKWDFAQVYENWEKIFFE